MKTDEQRAKHAKYMRTYRNFLRNSAPERFAEMKEGERRWRLAHPDKVNAYKVRHRNRYPEKRRAHQAVYRAVRDGVLVRPQSCEACATIGNVHAHHADYSKPLEVRWLCPWCHKQEEKREGSTGKIE